MREPRRAGLAILLLAPAFAAVVACYDEPTKERLCTPDANVFCRCDDRREGTKKCGSDGRTFGECTCSGEAAPASKPSSKDTTSRTPSSTSEEEQKPTTTTRSPSTTSPAVPVTSQPNPAPTTTSTPAPTTTTPPAPPPLGDLCKSLQDCCGQLKAAGYSDETCMGIVDARNEAGCANSHKNYTDFGDCS